MPLLSEELEGDRERLKRLLRFVSQNRSDLLEVNESLLDEFFATTPSPIDKRQVLEFIVNQLSEEENIDDETSDEDLALLREQVPYIYDDLLKHGRIKEVSDGRVLPDKLNRNQALAHIFAGESSGLLIEDAIEIHKSLKGGDAGYSDRYLEQLSENPYLYLCARMGMKSIYSHINYLPVVTDPDYLLKWLHAKLERADSDTVDLRTIFKSYPNPDLIDYFVFRHYIRELSSERGITLLGFKLEVRGLV
ncbi:hypothetical protein N9974_01305 [bacterium]|nr:hypothetical protein [bacterium]